MSDKSISNVPLVEVIDALRADLKAAQANSDPEHPLIIKEIEVELQVVVTKALDAKGKVIGKVKIGVLDVLHLGELSGEADMNGKWNQASTQKIKLKLSAKSLNAETGELDDTQIADVSEDGY